MYMPFTCPEFTAAVTNGKLGTATVGSSGVQEIVCNAGFEKNGGGETILLETMLPTLTTIPH